MWDRGVRVVHLPHIELILNWYCVWQVVSSRKGSLLESPDHPQLRHCPYMTAVGTGGSYLSRMAFSCCRSLSITGWIPSIRNSYRRWRRNSRLSWGSPKQDRLIGLWLFHKSPQQTHSSHCPTTSPATTHLELPWVQSSKKGQEETYLTLLFTPIRCPASLPLSPLPVFLAFGLQEWDHNVEHKLWFQTDLCLKSLLWHSPVLSFGENLSFLIYKMAVILPTGWYYITWWSMVTVTI